MLSTVWGIALGSSMIVFDGLYSFVSIGLSVLAVLALRFTSRGSRRTLSLGPGGRRAAVVVIKAATLGALCVYAAIGGVIDLVHGGREISALSAVIYAVVATLGGLVVGLLLRRATRPDRPGASASDLVRAESAEWLGDTLLSAGVLVGFGVALALVAAGRADLAAYIDPGMVVLVSLLFLKVPAKLIIGGMREIMSMSPPAEVLSGLQAVVSEIETRFGFAESFLRASKVGARMDIEIDYVLGEDSTVQTVAECDQVRQELHDRLADLGYGQSTVVSFTTDRRWAQ